MENYCHPNGLQRQHRNLLTCTQTSFYTSHEYWPCLSLADPQLVTQLSSSLTKALFNVKRLDKRDMPQRQPVGTYLGIPREDCGNWRGTPRYVPTIPTATQKAAAWFWLPVVRTVDKDSGSDEALCHMHMCLRNSKERADHIQATSWSPPAPVGIRVTAFSSMKWCSPWAWAVQQWVRPILSQMHHSSFQ